MAVKKFRPAKPKFRITKLHIIVFMLFFILSVFCAGYRITKNAEMAGYKAEIAQYEEKINNISDENEEYAEVLNSSDRKAYYEKIARDVYGYAKPGEYVFYKTAS